MSSKKSLRSFHDNREYVKITIPDLFELNIQEKMLT